ncbi:MAG: putative colanic acid biosynthesis acetyltransferase WcaF [Candidatus Sumerlaeota bacterium]|nr:putative colanic acid biosynthesis acetyltransferase WcaF [Candidatus Sumerlaeota bacterium]
MKPTDRLRPLAQRSAYDSPWPLRTRIRMAAWSAVWLLLFRPTPKFLFPWRVFLLRLFGARIQGRPFVSESARIKAPWNLTLGHRACIGPHAEVYNLAPVVIGARATLAQNVYLCGGTHDFSTHRLPLMVGGIHVGRDAFIGARAIVLPGVEIGDGVVAGAGSVVANDLPVWTICAGNPCRPLRKRPFDKRVT